MNHKNMILLDTYPLQKDMRIRMPKQILSNMQIEPGINFDIYISSSKDEIILKVNKEREQ